MSEETTDSTPAAQSEERTELPGTVLKRAREARGMSLPDVADATRIALRQLEAVENNDFGSLPGTPYAVGFARAYARAVGADEVDIAHGVREQLGMLGETDHYVAFEPVDPARVPPRRLAWVAAAVALVLAIAYGVWRTQFFSASTDEEISDLNNRVAAQAPVAPSTQVATPNNGPVVLTATSDVWLRIYDQTGERLFEKQMMKGESYTVPADANNPMILTGRPDAIAVTVGGKPVAPLGSPEKTISDVPVSAAALLARGSAPAQGGEGGATASQRPRAAAPSPKPAATSTAPAVRNPADAGEAGSAPATDTGTTD